LPRLRSPVRTWFPAPVISRSKPYIKRGTDIYTVKKFAGHADIRTTMRYVHALDKKDFDALEALQDEHSI